MTFIASPFNERLKRLGLSARNLEDTERSLLNKGLIKEVWLGKNLMLAPIDELYVLLGMDCPYRRNRWHIHSFLVLVAARLIEVNPLVKYVRCETFLGDANATLDLCAHLKDGQRWAYEVIHRSITNIPATIAKLQDKGFSQVTLLCTDFDVKQRAWATVRNAGFAPDFLSTVRCVIFSSLLRQRKQFVLRDTP